MRRVMNFKSLPWWRKLQAVGRTLDPANKTGWRHPRPGRFVHWETPLELFDPNWVELAQDREQWRHSRYRFVLGELVRLNARNAFGFGARPSPSACIDLAPPALTSTALARTRQSGQSQPWPPVSLVGAPSARGNALFSSWEVCRLQSLLPGVSVKCSGPCSQVLDIALGSHSVPDATVSSLVPRLTRLPVALAQATSSRPDQLRGLIQGGFRPCSTLARTAAEFRKTFECFLPMEVSLSDPRPWQLCVYHGGHRAGDNHAGVGVCLFLVVVSQLYEIYCYQSYLGQTCTVLSAEFQGAYLALLITLSFLTWMAHHPRTAVP